MSQNLLGLIGGEGAGGLSSQEWSRVSRGAVTRMSRPTLNPLSLFLYQAYSPGEGDRGAYGRSSVEVVGEMTMIGMRLQGGVGDLLFAVTGGGDSETFSSDPAILAKLLIGIGRHGMGATILGDCCWSGMPSVDSVGLLVVTVGELRGTWGVSIHRSGL